MCSTTSATTEALATVGEPTVTLPSLLTKRTRSKVNGCPASTARRSTSKVSPAATRYCLLPVSNIAYINLPAKRGRYKTIGKGRCQQTILAGNRISEHLGTAPGARPSRAQQATYREG